MADEMILTTAEAAQSGARPIARVNILDKETGATTPVDVRTCARGVVCDEGKTVQEHVNRLYEHIGDTDVHLTAEEKKGLETTAGAQEKADAALAKAKAYADKQDAALSMVVAQKISVVIGAEKPAAGPVLWFNTSRHPVPEEPEADAALLILTDAETDVKVNVDGAVHNVGNAVADGEATGSVYNFDIL